MTPRRAFRLSGWFEGRGQHAVITQRLLQLREIVAPVVPAAKGRHATGVRFASLRESDFLLNSGTHVTSVAHDLIMESVRKHVKRELSRTQFEDGVVLIPERPKGLRAVGFGHVVEVASDRSKSEIVADPLDFS